MSRSRMQRILGGPVPEDDQPVTIETQAVDAMRHATDKAALEHSVADLTIRLRHAAHEVRDLEAKVDELTAENDWLRRRMAELDRLAFPTMPLPDALQAELLLDLTDQPAAPYAAVNHPEPIEWVDVVEPSKNGTT